MAATHGFYTKGDIASRILPALCTLTVDKEKNVRDQVFITIKMFLSKMEKISEDPKAAAEQEKAESEQIIIHVTALLQVIRFCRTQN